jgi:CP family cyanate transporter-like MFS transporter
LKVANTKSGTTAFPTLVLVGVVLFALNLRGPLVAIATVTGDLNTDLGMSSTAIGLLTSLPVLCFGLAAPGASSLIARLGVERSVLLSLLGVLVGVLVRSLGGVPAALAGTVIMGLAITIGNVVIPVIIGRDFRGRVAAITGTYTATMNVGSMIALTVTGPLAEAVGWQLALAFNAVFPVLAATVWVPLSRRKSATGRIAAHQAQPAERPAEPTGRVPVIRRPTTWMLTIAFAGQAFAYYGLTAWLPTLLADEQGMTRGEAGAASSIFQVAALIGAFGTPFIINRFGGPIPAFLVNGALWATMPLGLLFAPDLWALWSALAGIAQGGGFVVIFTVVVMRARTQRESRQLSSIVQTGGYSVACLGPVIVGGLQDATGGWTASLLTVFTAICALTVLGSLAGRGVRR